MAGAMGAKVNAHHPASPGLRRAASALGGGAARRLRRRGLAPGSRQQAERLVAGLDGRCQVSFSPTSSLFSFERGEAECPRLVNPGRLSMETRDFLRAAGDAEGRASVVNLPYDEACEEEAFTVALKELKSLALYCVEDAARFFPDLCQVGLERLPLLAPHWQPLLREQRLWMSSGGAEGAAAVAAGFHWDHLQNIHVVLSGKKEVFLIPPLLAPALSATRFCPQVQWQMSSEDGRMRLGKLEMKLEESSSDYALVSVDATYQENLARHPSMASELKEPPLWVVLHPGDAIYIPPGWWHSVRTWRPENAAVPLALSVNFWYAMTPEVAAAQGSTLLTLEILSRQRATAGDPEDHLRAFLAKLDPAPDGSFVPVD
ncbi:unnamed protein product [Effrenium voratum]|uniref:JmjC domain-containing protein n=1 Tax=Effrenium voratum TaxID=2562239 RepID=A0AA36IZH3_9DINO|nr:unnamed protein product [Effrenium voratum]CAJ1429205.1 unnamed protein product [Effrenium voratum]